MKTTYVSKRYQNESTTITFPAEEVNECPLCKKAIKPVRLNMFHLEKSSPYNVHGHFLCTSCQSSFIADYHVILKGTDYESTGPLNVGPVSYVKAHFDNNITTMSPQFDKIYNQALAAETSGLDEIAGLGYRKALEFLVKDFAIHQHPSEEENIKKQMLSPCIKKYIDNPQIKTLVERSAWIGNDEAHYIRKQEERDVNDMKAFIKATVYFIGMVLITEDAASMEPK